MDDFKLNDILACMGTYIENRHRVNIALVAIREQNLFTNLVTNTVENILIEQVTEYNRQIIEQAELLVKLNEGTS